MDGFPGIERKHGDFEFERRFLVAEAPDEVRQAPATIVQSYLVADGGYAVRVRAQAIGVEAEMTAETDPVDLLGAISPQVNHAAITVKGPPLGGTRYEAERDLDVSEAVQVMLRGKGPFVTKVRYAVHLFGSPWVIDVFGGANHPLIVAECEKPDPVTDLVIPRWCVTEITDDPRFTNDALAVRPYPTWRAEHDAEVAANGPTFRDDFGSNEYA
ncbi:CYTH domain-containing protein [Xylanimonas ulmi]|nr:CYTH domain-containing protein [Xylanibacterium ulmi]